VAFRPRVDGLENLPKSGPFLLVANHSGLGLAEIACLVVMYASGAFGAGRRFAGMVHPISLRSWPAGSWMRSLGMIPSTYEAAKAALANGISVVVFPGGDHEAARPLWQANQVQFAGRKGFLKIARAMGVPIVPMGIRGSHYTAPTLYRSGSLLPRILVLPRLAGVKKRFPVTLLGVVGAMLLLGLGPTIHWWVAALLAWLWLALPLNQLPWIPASIGMRVGSPLAPSELFDNESTHPDACLDPAYERVQAVVQELVTLARPAPGPGGEAVP
jgi:hypothetical protein